MKMLRPAASPRAPLVMTSATKAPNWWSDTWAPPAASTGIGHEFDDPLHCRDRASKRQLHDIRAEVDRQRRRVQQGFQLRMIHDSGAAGIEHRQQRKADTVAGIRHAPPCCGAAGLP